MSHSVFYSIIQGHSDKDGDIFPENGRGTDSFRRTIPQGKKLSHFRLKKLPGTAPFAGCKIKSFPAVGRTGEQTWKVDWDYPIFGQIKLGLELFATPVNDRFIPVKVYHGEQGWEDFAYQLIKQKRDYKIIITNDLATYFWGFLNPVNVRPVNRVVDGGAVAITAIVAGSLLAIVGLSIFGAIFITSINNGYDIKGKFTETENGPTLEIDAKDPDDN